LIDNRLKYKSWNDIMINSKKSATTLEIQSSILQIEIVQSKPEVLDVEIQASSFRETKLPNDKET